MLQQHQRQLSSLSALSTSALHLRAPLDFGTHKLPLFDQSHSINVLRVVKVFRAGAEERLRLMETVIEAVLLLRALLRASDAKPVLEDCPLGLHLMVQSVWETHHHYLNLRILMINQPTHNLPQRLYMHQALLLSIWLL